MMKRVAVFAALAIAGLVLARVATVESQSSGDPTAVMPAAGIFTGLQPCEVPGVEERVLSATQTTTVYAGEFDGGSAAPLRINAKLLVYIVSGTGVAQIGAARMPVTTGEVVTIPRNMPHSIRPTAGTLRAIYVEDRG